MANKKSETSTSNVDIKIENQKPKTRVVSEEKLEAILDKMEKQAEQIEILQSTVSKQRLKEAGENHNKEFLLQGHLKRLRGELIIGWNRMEKKGKGYSTTVYNAKNEPIEIREEDSMARMEIIYKDNYPVGEKLVGHYTTLEGKDIVCDAVEFYRSTVLEKFDRIKDEGQFWIVRFHNPSLPQRLRININFINP